MCAFEALERMLPEEKNPLRSLIDAFEEATDTIHTEEYPEYFGGVVSCSVQQDR